METTSRTTAPSMAPSTKDPPSAEDESQRMERSAGVDGEGESQPRKRLLHLDWLRTQSVWNVVCGHAWWTAVDEASRTNANCDPTCSILATEGERMIDYTVDQGTLHTVPLFFLVSGILASGSIARSPGFGKFALRRLARLLPPFITGGIALFIFRAAVGDVESIDDIILSHLWFLWALALVQIGTYPCVRAYQSARRGEAYALLMALFAIPIGLLLLVGGLLFDKLTDGGNRGLWMAVIPFASVLALLCLVTARSLEVRGHSKGIVGAAVVGALAILAVATLLLAVPKPDTEEDEYDWVQVGCAEGVVPHFSVSQRLICRQQLLAAGIAVPRTRVKVEALICVPHEFPRAMMQVNLFAGVVQIILFYLFGAIAADCSEDLVNFFAAIPAGTIPVAVLLLSSYWPFFTFWYVFAHDEAVVPRLCPASLKIPLLSSLEAKIG